MERQAGSATLPFDPASCQLRVGLEIHQQLATSTKLFCPCPTIKSEELPLSFERRLRPTQSMYRRWRSEPRRCWPD